MLLAGMYDSKVRLPHCLLLAKRLSAQTSSPDCRVSPWPPRHLGQPGALAMAPASHQGTAPPYRGF